MCVFASGSFSSSVGSLAESISDLWESSVEVWLFSPFRYYHINSETSPESFCRFLANVHFDSRMLFVVQRSKVTVNLGFGNEISASSRSLLLMDCGNRGSGLEQNKEVLQPFASLGVDFDFCRSKFKTLIRLHTNDAHRINRT